MPVYRMATNAGGGKGISLAGREGRSNFILYNISYSIFNSLRWLPSSISWFSRGLPTKTSIKIYDNNANSKLD